MGYSKPCIGAQLIPKCFSEIFVSVHHPGPSAAGLSLLQGHMNKSHKKN